MRPCGHGPNENLHYVGIPWPRDVAWTPMCLVCWRYLNDEHFRRFCDGLPPLPDAPQPVIVQPYEPVPRHEWPAWARALSWIKKPNETGVGDTVHRLATGLGGEKFKAWYKRRTGEDCNCAARQKQFNEQYPYQRD